MTNEKIIEITFHGRGGQTAVTASQLLAELAYEEGFKDAISIPLIGAERRGAPIQAYTKLSKKKTIKTYDSVKNPDFILIFDDSLLEIPKIQDIIKEGAILVINSKDPNSIKKFTKNNKTFIIDATGICIKRGLMHASGPILNVPMLGAFGKVSGFYSINTIEKVMKRVFGEDKLEINLNVARDAYNAVKEV